jgi:hypothetical protein
MSTAIDAPLPLNAYRYVKDPEPVPLPPPRIGGLTRLLKEAVGESATVPGRLPMISIRRAVSWDGSLRLAGSMRNGRGSGGPPSVVAPERVRWTPG